MLLIVFLFLTRKNRMNLTAIVKQNDTHNTVTYAVLVPEVEDRNGQRISEDEIIKTAHEFGSNLAIKKINRNHKKGEENDLEKDSAVFVESFVAPVDIPTGEGQLILKGTWCVAIKYNDELYEMAKSGEITGISMEGE